MTSSRKQARQIIYDILKPVLVDELNLVESIYSYKISDIKGQSPTIVIMSGEVTRLPRGINSECYDSLFMIYVTVFVRDAESEKWTDEDVDDKLDEIESAIADIVSKNRSSANHQYLDNSQSTIVPIPVQLHGHNFIMDTIPLKIQIVDN